jgi:type IV secretion system protein VirB4
MAVRALGGRYAEIRAGTANRAEPACHRIRRTRRGVVSGLARGLLEQRSGPMTPMQSEALKSAISQNGKAREGLRNFRAFQELFR